MKWLVFLLFTVSLYTKEIHPITRINQWFKEENKLTEGRFIKYATLATVSADGHPHTRMIEISKLNPKEGAVFFTHQKTEKVSQIAFNPYGALNLWLPRTHRQVSIEGSITQVPQDTAEKAWKRMPRFMKLNFLASDHTGTLENQTVLEKRKKDLENQYPKEIPYPPSFIGYQLSPVQVIFYQVQPRSFAIKDVASLKGNQWNFISMEP